MPKDKIQTTALEMAKLLEQVVAAYDALPNDDKHRFNSRLGAVHKDAYFAWQPGAMPKIVQGLYLMHGVNP